MEKKQRTVNILKEKRHVPDHVNEERKKYIRIRRTLLEALKEEGRTIPQLSKATGLSLPDTTYYLMALQKFGDVCVESIDDMDEYYIYKLKNIK
jgi:predicted Rossmann fold nucleotide-binding protein DprA/Smf involved in DNA uptake